jgi:alanine racemase
MRTWAEISTQALRFNLNRIKQLAPNSKVVAMIKTNAYGHDLLIAAQALQSAVDYFGVATLDEAIAIRNKGITTPILLMPGFQSKQELELIQQYQVDSVVYDSFQFDLLKQAKQAVNVWLKFETGMHRLGLAPEVAESAIQQALSMPQVKVVALMTHFASADSPNPTKTNEQMQAFKLIVAGHRLPLSVANSSALLRYPELHYNFVRPGMMLYGVSPLGEAQAKDHGITPVMTLKTSIIRLIDLKPGESVGYGSEWIAERPSKIAVLGIGYGDGYPRQAKNSVVLFNGCIVRVVGRVSMDYLTIDVTDVPEVKLHDVVTLWGEGLPIEEVASKMQTSPYALLSNLSERITRVAI